MSDDRGALVIGVDVSTTAAKAIAVDASGIVHAKGSAAFGLENPAPGGWEQDATAWTRAMMDALREVATALGPRAAEVRALCVAHQRETFVVTDRDGAPLAPAIVWMDTRSTVEVRAACEELAPETILDRSGKVPCTTPSLYKIRMLLTRLRPELERADARVLDVHGFAVRALTGRFVTSTASADPLGLVDMRRGAYDDDLDHLARVSPSQLAELVPPGAAIGPVLPEVAAQLGLPATLQVVAGAGDGQAASLGAGAFEEGAAYLNLGTAVVAGITSRSYRVSRSFRTLFGAMPGTFLLESDLKGGTLILDWLADRILGEGRFERTSTRIATLTELERKAAALPPGADGLLALPYWAAVMNPYWDDDASGALVGLRPEHGPEHVYRAVCEGLAFEHRLVFERIEAETAPIRSVAVVGGASRRDLVMQIFSDVLGRALDRSESDETTAFGAAILAAPAGGLAASVEAAAARMARKVPAQSPGVHAPRYARLYEECYRELYPSLARTMRALARSRERT